MVRTGSLRKRSRKKGLFCDSDFQLDNIISFQTCYLTAVFKYDQEIFPGYAYVDLNFFARKSSTSKEKSQSFSLFQRIELIFLSMSLSLSLALRLQRS